jgi:aminoglycoside N3'-acetyltransferase
MVDHDMALNSSELAAGLRRLGVRAGMALEVHCAMSRFGAVEGGADAVIDALMQVVGSDGTIVMPAFRLSPNLPLTDKDKQLGLTLKIRLLAEEENHTAMGIVADTFRQRLDVVTGSGIFRVSAWGRDAARHATGLQHLIDSSGYALLLGVDIYALSAMHTVEDALPETIRARFKPSAEALALYPADQWFIEAWSPEAKPWYKIQAEAYARGLITDIAIGQARCLFLPVRPVIDLYRQALLERPFELYGVDE